MEQLLPAASVLGLIGQVSEKIAKSLAFVPVMVTAVIVTAELPVLVSETPSGELVLPWFCAANVRLDGFAVSVLVIVWPVPLRETVCGLPVALSVKVTLALSAPSVLGENVTPTVQLAPGPRVAGLAGQLSELMAKLLALVPVMPMLVNVTPTLPVFVTSVLCGELVVPVFWVPKLRLLGAKVRVRVGVAPVPVNATDCGLPVALSVNTILAVRVPVAVGLKVTVTVHALPAPRVAGLTGQLLLAME
jgi:hypothetical protein